LRTWVADPVVTKALHVTKAGLLFTGWLASLVNRKAMTLAVRLVEDGAILKVVP
jgi:hypothetical protein